MLLICLGGALYVVIQALSCFYSSKSSKPISIDLSYIVNAKYSKYDIKNLCVEHQVYNNVKSKTIF